MRNAPGPAIRLLLIGALLLGPGGVNAADLGTLPVPGATLKKGNFYQNQPLGSCSLDEPDVLGGMLSAFAEIFGFGPNSPAMLASPIYNGGNRILTSWGRGWSSDMDHFLNVGSAGTLIWHDAKGNEMQFFRSSNSSTLPIPLTSPIGMVSDMKITALSGGNPTAVELRDAEGTMRLFTVAESTSILRLTRLLDRNNNTVNYTRGSNGRLTRTQDIHGRYVVLDYTSAGLVKMITDSAGRVATYTYDSLGRRTSETGPVGTIQYQYDQHHRLIRIIYPNGGIRNYTYDSQDRVTSQDDGAGKNRTTYVYESTRTIVSDSTGGQTINEFVERHGLKKIARTVDSAGGVWSYTYDSQFRLESVTDPLGRATNYSYDGRGNISSIVDPAGNSVRATFESAFNQITSLTDGLNRTNRFTYDSKGNLTTHQDAAGHATHFTHDGFGHLTQAKDALNKQADFTYSPNGSLYSTTDSLGRMTILQTDALSRITRTTDPRGKHTDLTYDSAGNLTSMTDALDGVTQFSYVPGRQAKLLSAVTDAKNQTTAFQHDDLGRVTRTINALSQPTAVSYDAASRPASITDRNGRLVRFSYDDLSRMTTLSAPEGDVRMEYDAVGNLTAAKHYNGSERLLTYDARDFATGIEQVLPNGFSTSISYVADANGNRTSMTTPWGSFAYTYDAMNRVISVTNPDTQSITFAYDALGRPVTLTYPNGTEAIYSYDNAGQVAQILHRRTTDHSVITVDSYTYDANGNRTTASDLEGVHAFTFDDLNRLTAANHPATSDLPVKNESFAYDAVGNRTSDAVRSGYQYDAANRLISDSSFTYTSDANGNITSRTNRGTGVTITYSYDTGNRLIKVSGALGEIAAYKYDAAGNRVEKNVSGVITRYVYDGLNLLAVLDGNNNLQQLFTNGPGLDVPLMMKAGENSYFLHADALGSIDALTTTGAGLVEKYNYQSFGKLVVKDAAGVQHAGSTVGNPFSYTGRELDPETGLYYLRARHLDPDTGRFVQEDALASVNQYAYAINNPVTFTDNTGFAPDGLLGDIANFIGGWGAGAQLNPGANPYDFYVTNSAAYQYGQGFGLAVTGTIVILGAAMLSGLAMPVIGVGSVAAPVAIAPIGILANRANGLAWEKALRIPQALKEVIRVGTQARVPDFFNHSTKTLYEAKAVRNLRYTKQIKDFIAWARERGYKVIIKLKPGYTKSVAKELSEIAKYEPNLLEICNKGTPVR